jgi:hypothetical protein
MPSHWPASNQDAGNPDEEALSLASRDIRGMILDDMKADLVKVQVEAAQTVNHEGS